jgi:midasin (ATPase involved in ribosome maturation)
MPKETIKNEADQYIPHDLPPYHDHDGLLSFLALAAKDNLPTLIIGETGTGKTTAVRTLAGKALKPYRRVNLNGGTTADELVGRILLNKEGTYWADGVLTDAVRKGYWIVLDEINAAGADVLFALHSLLDDDRMLVLAEHDGEIVRPHDEFRLFATMNPSGDYAGTREMSKALMSRFPLVLTANYPKEKEETDIIVERTGLKADIAMALVKIAGDARTAHREAKMDFPFSTRDLLNVALIANSLGGDIKHARTAISACILGKCSREDALAVVDMMDLHIPDGSTVTK